MPQLTRRTLLAAGLATSASLMHVQALQAHAAQPPASTAKPSIPALTVDLGAYCVGDGVTNDERGLNRALARLAQRGGGTLSVPARQFRIEPRGWIQVPANIAIVGQGPESEFLLTARNHDDFTMLFRLDSPNVVISSLKLTRQADVYGYFIGAFASHVYLEEVVFQGSLDKWNNDFNAVRVAPQGQMQGLSLVGCSAISCGYGVYLSEDESSIVDGVYIDNFTGRGNYADDIELCAPSGTLRNVLIQNSSFTQNRSNSTGAGFGIGLAHVTGAEIRDCTFSDYPMNGIHIERETSGVSVMNNTFRRVSTLETGAGFAAPIIILSGSHDVEIGGNTFDLQGQTNDVNAIYVGPGGSRETAPWNIKIHDNTALLQAPQQLLANYGDGTVTLIGNSLP